MCLFVVFLYIMFQISFQTSKGQKNYRKNLQGVRSEPLLSIFLSLFCPNVASVQKKIKNHGIKLLLKFVSNICLREIFFLTSLKQEQMAFVAIQMRIFG